MPPRSKQSGKPFLSECVVAIAGDLGEPGWSEDKVRQWVTTWGGKFVDAGDDDVTHLLCTERNFKKKIAPVKAALKRKKSAVNIVTRDWLEDSIEKKRALSAKDEKYLLQKQHAQNRKREQASRAMEVDEVDGVDKNRFHIYRDETFFEYDIELVRNDEESGNIGQRHNVKLWESNAKPHGYNVTTGFYKKARAPRESFMYKESQTSLKDSLDFFKKFFKGRTGIAWDDRISKAGTTSTTKFQYKPPTGGKPVGLVNGRPGPILTSDANHKEESTSKDAAPGKNSAGAQQATAARSLFGNGSKSETTAAPGPSGLTPIASHRKRELTTHHEAGRPSKRAKPEHGNKAPSSKRAPTSSSATKSTEIIVLDSDSDSAAEHATAQKRAQGSKNVVAREIDSIMETIAHDASKSASGVEKANDAVDNDHGTRHKPLTAAELKALQQISQDQDRAEKEAGQEVLARLGLPHTNAGKATASPDAEEAGGKKLQNSPTITSPEDDETRLATAKEALSVYLEASRSNRVYNASAALINATHDGRDVVADIKEREDEQKAVEQWKSKELKRFCPDDTTDDEDEGSKDKEEEKEEQSVTDFMTQHHGQDPAEVAKKWALKNFWKNVNQKNKWSELEVEVEVEVEGGSDA